MPAWVIHSFLNEWPRLGEWDVLVDQAWALGLLLRWAVVYCPCLQHLGWVWESWIVVENQVSTSEEEIDAEQARKTDIPNNFCHCRLRTSSIWSTPNFLPGLKESFSILLPALFSAIFLVYCHQPDFRLVASCHATSSCIPPSSQATSLPRMLYLDTPLCFANADLHFTTYESLYHAAMNPLICSFIHFFMNTYYIQCNAKMLRMWWETRQTWPLFLMGSSPSMTLDHEPNKVRVCAWYTFISPELKE